MIIKKPIRRIRKRNRKIIKGGGWLNGTSYKAFLIIFLINMLSIASVFYLLSLSGVLDFCINSTATNFNDKGGLWASDETNIKLPQMPHSASKYCYSHEDIYGIGESYQGTIISSDIDNDGDLDIITATESGFIRAWQNPLGDLNMTLSDYHGQ